jgi:hypothetical protein
MNPAPNRLAVVWRVRRKIVDSLRTASREPHAYLQAALRGVDLVLVAAFKHRLGGVMSSATRCVTRGG